MLKRRIRRDFAIRLVFHALRDTFPSRSRCRFAISFAQEAHRSRDFLLRIVTLFFTGQNIRRNLVRV